MLAFTNITGESIVLNFDVVWYPWLSRISAYGTRRAEFDIPCSQLWLRGRDGCLYLLFQPTIPVTHTGCYFYEYSAAGDPHQFLVFRRISEYGSNSWDFCPRPYLSTLVGLWCPMRCWKVGLVSSAAMQLSFPRITKNMQLHKSITYTFG